MANKKALKYRYRLMLVFISLTILIVGSLSLIESMSLDYYSVLGTLVKIGPAAFVMGALGYVMGFVLDQPRRGPKAGYTNYFVQEMMKKELESGDFGEGEDDFEGGEDDEKEI